MPPDAQHPGSPEDWMRYAKADLALARVPLPKDGMYELLCFHAQQAAEKSLKAVLIHYGVEPLRTHNLERLIDLLPAHIPRASELNESVRLTVYATAVRYPGGDEGVREEEYQAAVEVATTVVHWANGVIQGRENRP